MCIEPIHLYWNQIGTKFIIYSLNINHAQLCPHEQQHCCSHFQAVFTIQNTNYNGISRWDASDQMLPKETTYQVITYQVVLCSSLKFPFHGHLLHCTSNKVRKQLDGLQQACIHVGNPRNQKGGVIMVIVIVTIHS